MLKFHRNRKKDETGATSIEAVISLTFFMLSILALMFMAAIIQVQANMQYAIGQTAKEISGYYYLLDKLGLAAITSGQLPDETKKKLNSLDSTLASFSSLAGDVKHTADQFQDLDELTPEKLQDFMESAESTNFKEKAESLSSSFKEMVQKEDPVEQMKAVLQLFGKTLISKAFSYYVTPYVCQALVPKYLSNGKDVEAYCEAMGLKWNCDKDDNATEYMDFKNSQLLMDGRSIKITVEYTINTKPLTFGLVDTVLKCRQTAATAAWIRPEDGENSSKKKIKDLPVPPEVTEPAKEEEEKPQEETE